MNQSNSVEAIDRTNLTEQTKFWLDETSKIENYFYQEINQRKSCIKKLSEYIAAFDYLDKILIVLSATSGGVCISFVSVVGTPFGITGAGFTLIFSLITEIVKKLQTITRNKKKKHDKILMLAISELNITSTDWHGNKAWRICYSFEGER